MAKAFDAEAATSAAAETKYLSRLDILNLVRRVRSFLQFALSRLHFLFIKQEPGQAGLFQQDQWLGRRQYAGVTGKCREV